MQKININIHMCILIRSASACVVIASPRTSQHGEATTSPKRTKIKPVMLCAHSGYQASSLNSFSVQILHNLTNVQLHIL